MTRRPRHRDEVDCERLTMRRDSRVYSTIADQHDILNPQTRLEVRWQDIRLDFVPRFSFKRWYQGIKQTKDTVTALNGCYGHANPGELVAIMGPSGSGKTKLLEVLSCRLSGGKLEGNVLVNGQKRTGSFRHAAAYVEQGTSQLDSLFTVREMMEFTASLCLPKRYSESEKAERIERLFVVLGLDELEDVMIGTIEKSGLSYGERKRLLIALKLLREPRVIFLDEPTSGLDSTAANTLIIQLQQLALLDNLTIILSVHQPRPSMLDHFDRLILLGKGRTIFEGSLTETLEYFSGNGHDCPVDVNPADFLIDLISMDMVPPAEKPWNIRVVEGGEGLTKFERNTTRWEEYKALMGREYLYFRRSGNSYWIILLINIILALFIGFVWFQIPDEGYQAVQNRVGLLVFLPRDRTVVLAIVSILCGAKEGIRRERYSSMYRPSSYYAMLLTFNAAMELLFATCFLITVYYIAGLRYTPFTALLTLAGLHMLILLAAYGIGIISACIFEDFTVAFMVAMSVNLIWFLFGGLLVNTEDISWVLRWIRYLSAHFYYTLGANQNEFDGQTLDGQPGSFWLQLYAFDLVSVVWCAGALLIFNMILHLTGYWLLHIRTKPKFII